MRVPLSLSFVRLFAARQRTIVAFAAVALASTPALPTHADPTSVTATDGYFDVSRIDAATYSIHESHYRQLNIAYVIKGQTRAILVDSGSGTRDIAFVADKVTKKPMTVVASHVHYDHIGSHAAFQQVAMADLPELRARVEHNHYTPTMGSSLYPWRQGFEVTEWWKPGDVIELGGRRISVVHTPGHSSDSITLVDREAGYAFVGDLLYGGDLDAWLPGADLEAWLESTRTLLRDFPEIRRVFGAHEKGSMTREDLVALEATLAAIVEGRTAGERLWWLGWQVSRYAGPGFSILAAPPATAK
jgi:hydroxyacylglutathione hydrolase